MSDLIEALQIFLKYGNPHNPTHCEHDVMLISGIEPLAVSEPDKARLKDLGFYVSREFGDEGFQSYRYGSA